jgi:hypothetical protein
MRTDTSDFAALLALALTAENRPELEIRLLDGFGLAQYREIFALLDLVLNQDVAAANIITPTGTDRLYLNALVALVQTCPLVDGSATMPQPVRHLHINEDYDFFYAIRDDPDWSLLRCMNFLYRAKIRPGQKCAIVTSVRNEGINILEWIAHHRQLGVDDFIIYTNNNDDGSSDLLRGLAEQNIIHLVWNKTALGQDGGNMFPIQAKAYGHACEFLDASLEYEFLYFTDMDEFLLTQALDQARPLDDLFERMAKVPAAAVAFNWKIFTSQCVFRRRAGLNFERFQHTAESDHVKAIAQRARCLSFSTSHLPRLIAGDVVLDGGLKPAAAPGFKMPPVYDYGQINHYWHKSFEEFIAKHLRVRGDAKFAHFFSYWGNREKGPFEAMPESWTARVKAEMAILEGLPGIAAATGDIETNFIRQLQDFDRHNDSEALFYSHFVKYK